MNRKSLIFTPDNFYREIFFVVKSRKTPRINFARINAAAKKDRRNL